MARQSSMMKKLRKASKQETAEKQRKREAEQQEAQQQEEQQELDSVEIVESLQGFTVKKVKLTKRRSTEGKFRPEVEEIQGEMDRLSQQGKYYRALRSTIGTLVVVAAIAVLVSTLFLPVLRVTGTSMEPNLFPGEIIVGVRTNSFSQGQVCSFYFNNRLVLKRVIGVAGDWIEIDDQGHVKVNQIEIDEPYVQELSLGINDMTYPYQVPDGRVFVLGDNRETSVDSRSTAVGCVAIEDIVGKILFRVWPLEKFGYIRQA